jgi:RNA polymerase sigma-70 factor (ECF subfamily)
MAVPGGLPNEELNGLLHRGFRYAFALSHAPERAEDLLQDAILALLRRGGPWNPGYLLKAIRSRFIDLHRREQLVVMRALDDVPEPAVYAGFDEPAGNVDPERLEQALAALRPAEREAIYLHCVEGYTAQEIADLTGQPRNTVLSLLHRGRAKAQAHYAPPQEGARG